MTRTPRLGVSGVLTRAFIQSPLTPLILLAGLALGLIALVSLPREEEPQISVPMVDIFVTADGLKAEDAVKLVTEPLETIVKAINGVEHVYSNTADDRVVVTARFFVGTPQDDAILRVHEKVRANYDRIPLGIPEPLIVGRGIDDVAIVTLTLAPKPGIDRYQDNALYQMAENLQVELAKLDDIGLSYIVGGRPDQIRVEPIPEKLSLYGITLTQLVNKVRQANRSFLAGRVREKNESLAVAAGQTLQGIPDVGLLLLTARDGRPVYVRDIANVIVGAKPLESQAWNFTKTADGTLQRTPAVTVALAKRAGANAVVVSKQIVERLAELEGTLVPDDVDVIVTRNYGETANDKVNELLFHLGLATLSIVLLVGLAIGWREGATVLVVIPLTILLTLFASWLLGYTINRVSLFALIFSIGILVDDAIVVIENIARHWAMHDQRSRVDAAIDAVAEVGNPTIFATLTVVAALLPMLFVSGLMGPYMSPIPANASAAMILSFFIAVTVTPWLMLRFGGKSAGHASAAEGGWLGRAYMMATRPVIATRARALAFLVIVGIATLLSLGLFATKSVTVKLLPFDDKSELQVVLDLRKGASLEETDRVLAAAAERLADLPELSSIQAYAGTAAPFNFNGLVRHYYLRNEPQQGDLQINLAPKSERHRTSHEIALDVRRRIEGLPASEGTTVKVVEVPPGPPVIATLLAEIYGADADQRRAVANEVRDIFRAVPFIVDDDVSFREQAPRLRFEIDQDNLEFRKVEEQDVYDTIAAYLGGTPVGYSHKGGGRHPVEIAVQLPKTDLAITEQTLSTPVPANALPGASEDRRARRRRERQARESVLPYLPPQRAPRRDGDGRARRPIRGADLRHARRRRPHRQARLGQPAQARDQPARPAVERDEAGPALGRRVGGDLCDLPRHGRGFRGRLARHLRAGRRTVPLVHAAARHPDAGAAHPDRHHARSLAVRSTLHGDVDDRLHCASRHHRAQLDPARRFHHDAPGELGRLCARFSWRPAPSASSRSC